MFDFDIVIFHFLYGAVPRHTYDGVYISQLIKFARVCSHVTDFNAPNKSSPIGIINFERPFPNFITDTMNWFQIQYRASETIETKHLR